MQDHVWIRKERLYAHVYKWICECCGTEAFNLLDKNEPTHASQTITYKTNYGVYNNIEIKKVNEIMSCSECAIKEVIT